MLIVEGVDGETQAALALRHGSMRTCGARRSRRRAAHQAARHPVRACSWRAATTSSSTTPRTRPSPTSCAARWRALSAGGERLGCLQAQLNIYNSDATWFTRQFTVEYTALFDCILPTLERLRLPVPLGGTSNHFPGIA